MKNIILGFAFCLAFNAATAQNDDTFWTFSGYQFGSGKIITETGNYSIDEKYNHVLARMDIVDYSDGYTAYGDGSLLAVLVAQLTSASSEEDFKEYNVLGPIVELGAGFALNNKKPISIGSALEAKITLGLTAGYRGFTIPPVYNKYQGGTIFGPEIGSLIAMGDNIVFAPKFGYAILVDEESIGNRVVFEVNTMLKVFSWLGVSVTPSFERFNFKETDERGKYSAKFTSFRIGVSILNL